MKRLRWLAIAGLAFVPAVPADDTGPSEEAIAKAIEEVKADLPDTFTVEVVEGWFVVASNASGSSHERAKGTVTHTYRAMYQEFFEARPDRPLKVYLFRDSTSYEAYNERAYGRPPTTPYGFYRASERKMVMNIATGTGTLAHEMVHPLLAQDFPAVPSWFNEGFASLFEQSSYTDEGTMRGMVNWRLPGLQRAFARGDDVSLEGVMKTTTDEFYGEGSGTHYAIARYLCLWLQEKALLRDYYRAFRTGHGEDPTGVATLEKTTGKSLADLEKEWKEWVGTLRFER